MVRLGQAVSVRDVDGVLIDADWSRVGVTEQFIENADVYHQRYFNSASGRSILDIGLRVGNVDRSRRMDVLDIGSGSGNSVFAALDSLPNANIVATDISPTLLKILLDISKRVGSARLSTYCFDVHKSSFFAEASFDLVIGNSVLHHMLDPKAVLANVTAWCNRRGSILLFEPLEAGAHLLAMVYHTLIDEFDDAAPPELIGHFRAMITDYNARFGIPNVKPWTQYLDDKWFFSKDYFRSLGSELGFEVVAVEPTRADVTSLIEVEVMGTIRASGHDDLPIPAKLPQLLKDFDAGISETLKRNLVPFAAIVLRKTQGA
jgi:ubiquinone/menaquinone biosynthesis C-methylase UbiE